MSGDNRNGTSESSGHEEASSEGSGLTRRQMVTAGAATWASVSLAGCHYLTGPGDDGGKQTTDDGQQTTGGGQQTNTTVTSNTTTTDDTGTGGGGGTTTACQQRAKFMPGMEVGILIDVFNSEDGSFAGTDVVESVTVSFPDRDIASRELAWTGSHETQSEESWGGTVDTPPDAEPGTYRYEVTVEPKPESDLEKTTVTDRFTIV